MDLLVLFVCVCLSLQVCVCMHMSGSLASSHPGCSEFLVRGLSPSHLVVMETRAAAGAALAWLLYVGCMEHRMLNRARSAGQIIVSLSLHVAKTRKLFTALSRLPGTFI